MLDPALVVVVAVVSIVLAEGARAVVATLFGDETPQVTDRLWTLHRNVEVTGTVIVPALLALLTGVAVGWPSRVPVREAALGRLGRVVVASSAPVVHGVLAAVGLLLPGDVGLAVLGVNLATAGFLLLPLPPLPGGGLLAALVGPLGAGDGRWMQWRRGPIAPWGMAAAAVLVVAGLLELVADQLGITPAL